MMQHKLSFWGIIGFVFLLPIFFIPAGLLSLSDAKSALLVLGVTFILVVFLYELWKEREITLPRHYLLYTLLFLPVVYFLSAILATPSSLSLLGYNFEVGTFGYILIGVLFATVASVVLSKPERVIRSGMALIASLSLLAIFTLTKIAAGLSGHPDFLALGNFFGNMGNPLGNWTDLGVVFGLLALLSTLLIGMLPMKRSMKICAYFIFLLSTVLLVVINFGPALSLTLGGSVLALLYFFFLEKDFHNKFLSKPTFLPALLSIICLLLLLTQFMGDKSLGTLLSKKAGLNNTEVRPTLSTTLSISKAVLSGKSLLGSGPNTFESDWLIYKPAEVNATPFWGTTFTFGSGFIATQIASTGMLGTLLWLIFFVFLMVVAFRSLTHMPDARPQRFALIFSLVGTLFLWVGAFLYTPSAATLMLAFGFTGFLLSSAVIAGIVPVKHFDFKAYPKKQIFSGALALVFVALILLGFTGTERALGAFHLKRAISLTSKSEVDLLAVESHLNKAVKWSPVDSHYLALSQVHLVKANKASTQEELEASLGGALEESRRAVAANPARYENWVHLGDVYSALVGEPLKVAGAYEYAQLSYSEAFKRNPSNPELPLLLARLEVNNGSVDRARSYIRNAIALKEDYSYAYLLLAQLEVSQNNVPAAIASAERLAELNPGNAGLYFEVGLLKYSINDYNGAAASFGRALEISPEYANAKYYLGLSLASLGEKDKARVYFEELLVSNPGNAELKQALENLK